MERSLRYPSVWGTSLAMVANYGGGRALKLKDSGVVTDDSAASS